MSQQGAPKMPPQPFHWAGWDSVGVPDAVTPEQYADALDFAEHWDLSVIWVDHGHFLGKSKQETQ